MRVAIPQWRGRVSPVFDVAGNLLLIDMVGGRQQASQSLAIDMEQPQDRAHLLAQHGVRVLICGAISWPLERALLAAGIEVISQTCGEIDQVLAAFCSGQLRRGAFLMPGCCGRRRHWRARGQGRWRRGY